MSKDPIMLLYICSTMTALAMLVMGIYTRRAQNSFYFTLLSLAIFIRNLGFLFEITSSSLESAIAATQVQYFGGPFIAPFFLFFALEYCSVKIPKMYALFILIIPVSACILMLTWPLNGMYYTSAVFAYGAYNIPHLLIEGSVFYHIFQAYNALLSVLSDVILLYFFMRRDRAFRRQSFMVVIASALPLLSILLLLAGDTLAIELDLMPIALGITCLLLGYSFWRFDFYRATPVARERTIETMGDGYVLVDMKGAFQDANIAAKRILLPLMQVSVGRRLAEMEELSWLVQSADVRGDSFEVAQPDGSRKYYRLSETQVELAGRTVGRCLMIFDATEQIMLQQKLEDALVEAEIANKAKSSFLANMSHEIRTPMNAIWGITEILVLDETLPVEVMEGLAKIHSSCDMLLGIINDVLDFSKIEAGKLDVRPAPYEIASLVNDSVQLNMTRIGGKRIQFLLEIDEAMPARLMGDELRIKQILNNLLSNAFKYTESGQVTLRVGFDRSGGGKLTLEVEDTGHGMTKQQIDKLFEEYSRFQSGTSRVIEGTGLGMAITQRLVCLMDGSIRAESELGKGSLFMVSLPQEIIDDKILSAEVAENLRSFKMSLLTSQDRRQVARDPMPYGKVLVVDDVETNLYVAVGLLKLYGLQIETVMSGYEAVEKIKEGCSYDIIFMDHMMSGMDGIEATKAMRNLGYTEPVVALTANAVAKQSEMFLQNGFDDFIAKPIDVRQLHTVLNRLVRDKQPPNVIAEARRMKETQAVDEKQEPELDPSLAASFVRDARKATAALEAWLKDGAAEPGIQEFTIVVHGMKSALANIREAALSAEAKELETLGKEGELAQIREAAPEFLKKLQKLITISASSERDDAPDDVPFLCEKLSMIQEKCEDYDRKGVMDILSEIDLCSRQTRDILERITEAVLHSDFEEAGTIAAEYAASFPMKE